MNEGYTKVFVSLDGTEQQDFVLARAIKVAAPQVSLELDVRGQLPEEALDNVDKYLDDCMMAGVSEVSIVHGKGTGALRKAVHDILRRNKAVKSFRLGVYGEGESGVTVVTLK